MPSSSRAWIAVSALLFVVAVLLPAAYYDDGPRTGLDMLILGWIGVMVLHFGWYANPLLLTSWILGLCRSTPRRAVVRVRIGYVALGLACTSLVSLPLSDMTRLKEFASADFVRFGPAIFVWLAAIVVDVVAASKSRAAHEVVRPDTMTPQHATVAA